MDWGFEGWEQLNQPWSGNHERLWLLTRMLFGEEYRKEIMGARTKAFVLLEQARPTNSDVWGRVHRMPWVSVEGWYLAMAGIPTSGSTFIGCWMEGLCMSFAEWMASNCTKLLWQKIIWVVGIYFTSEPPTLFSSHGWLPTRHHQPLAVTVCRVPPAHKTWGFFLCAAACKNVKELANTMVVDTWR